MWQAKPSVPILHPAVDLKYIPTRELFTQVFFHYVVVAGNVQRQASLPSEQEVEQAIVSLQKATEEDRHSDLCLMPWSLDFYMKLFAANITLE